MINAKETIYNILSDERLTSQVTDIFDAYPTTIENFPCIIFIDSGQTDIEFADNQPLGVEVEITIHIFTKTLDGYLTTSQIGIIVDEIMKENYFICNSNMEVPDVDDNVRHRIMVFRNNFFSEYGN